jgi:hypothetical protein
MMVRKFTQILSELQMPKVGSSTTRCLLLTTAETVKPRQYSMRLRVVVKFAYVTPSMNSTSWTC